MAARLNGRVSDATATPPAVKRMKLRDAGICARCGAELAAGELADYDRTSKTVSCVSCEPRRALDDPAAVSAAPRHAITPDLAPELEIVDGVAGGSARHEFERRHDARQERVQTAHPKTGKLLLAVFEDPQTTTAWASGAVGEERLGGMLAEVAGPSLRVLHDRRIPGTKANLDHLVVCPSGVFVVDAKRYRNQRPELRVEGGILRRRQELLFVGGRDRTKLVEATHKQVALVRQALADRPEVPVCGVLCFIEADWPLIGGSFAVQGVAVVWMKKLLTLLAELGPLTVEEIADVQWQLHQAFPRHGQA
jgi:Nuclease-related domain.